MPALSRLTLRLALLALFLTTSLVLSTACSPAPAPPPTADKSAPQPAAAPTSPAPTVALTSEPKSMLPASKPVDPAIAAKIEPILTKTAAIRALPVKAKVPLGTLDRSQLHAYLVALFEREHAWQELEKEQAILVMLDLLGRHDNLYQMQIDLLGEQITGLYDFEAKEMRLIGVGNELSPLDEITLSHEYVHALQDQNFDIGTRMKQARGDSERSSALQALIEGDATFEMSAYARKNLSAQQLARAGQLAGVTSQEKLKSAPSILQLGLLFPYQQGGAFVGSLFQSGGWTAVDKALASPPTTVTQIFHPDKYLAGQGAQAVEMPKVAPALGSDWFLYKEDVLGELGILAYLASGVPVDKAAKAAEGWGGDKLALYRNSGGYDYVLVGAFTWDTAQDASEFFGAVRDLRQRKGGLTSPDSSHLSWSVPDNRGYLAVDENRAVLAIATSDTVMKKLIPTLGN